MLEFDKVSVFAKNARGQVLGASSAKIMLDLMKTYGIVAKYLAKETLDGDEYGVWENGDIKVLVRDFDMSRYPGACIFSLSDTGKRSVYEMIVYFLRRGIKPDVRESKDAVRNLYYGSDDYVLRDGNICRSSTEFRKLYFQPEDLISKEQFCKYLEEEKFETHWEVGRSPLSHLKYASRALYENKSLHDYDYEAVTEESVSKIYVDIELYTVEKSQSPWLKEFLHRCGRERELNHVQFQAMIEAIRNARDK